MQAREGGRKQASGPKSALLLVSLSRSVNQPWREPIWLCAGKGGEAECQNIRTRAAVPVVKQCGKPVLEGVRLAVHGKEGVSKDISVRKQERMEPPRPPTQPHQTFTNPHLTPRKAACLPAEVGCIEMLAKLQAPPHLHTLAPTPTLPPACLQRLEASNCWPNSAYTLLHSP